MTDPTLITADDWQNLQLRSLVTPDGGLELALHSAPVPDLRPDQVLVRVEAAPINPSDVGVLLAGADPTTMARADAGAAPAAHGRVPDGALRAQRARVGRALPVGNEGAGVVVDAGSDPQAQRLIGRTVAVSGGGMYAQYRAVPAAACLVLEEGTSPRDAASSFVNPMTVLSMVETMRLEGHRALVHTAAASNLGQMLNRVCQADGIGLVNIVRRPEQAALLRAQGAAWVVDSSAPEFSRDLVEAVAATGATLAFDAIGGGDLASRLLAAMEAALTRDDDEYRTYGSPVHKQVYVYGGLDRGPTLIRRSFGMAWGIGGWLLMPTLERVGAEAVARMRRRVAAELRTTFASDYGEEISLEDMIAPDAIARWAAASTGGKCLVRPHGR